MTGLDWQNHALCLQVGGDHWFPEVGQPTRTAKAICAACEVRVECLQYALADPNLRGVWGGTSQRDRSAIRVRRSRGEVAA